MIGVVRSFDMRRGAGLIARDDGGPDVFVHISVVERAGLSGLAAGDRVSFDIQVNRAAGRTFAAAIALI